MNVLITGVSTGIGATTAELLLRSGHDVYGTVRKLGDADQLALHPAFSALAMDVTNRPSIVKAIATIKASGKPLHAVINNAGIAVPRPASSTPPPAQDTNATPLHLPLLKTHHNQ